MACIWSQLYLADVVERGEAIYPFQSVLQCILPKDILMMFKGNYVLTQDNNFSINFYLDINFHILNCSQSQARSQSLH